MRHALFGFAALFLLACGGSNAPSTTSSSSPVSSIFGASGSVGHECTVDDDCSAGFCDRTVPGGYCTQACTTTDDCDTGTCDGEFCFRGCDAQGDCRSDEFLCFEVAPEQGVCSFDVGSAVPDAANIGAPCRADLECAAPENVEPLCAVELDYSGNPTGYADGMCIAMNCEDDAACGAGARCVQGPVNLCVPACETATDCRTGYTCETTTQTCAPEAP